jgi:hypothetical protein
MAQVYKNFDPLNDIIAGDVQTISQPIWSENMNPFSQSFASGIGFFTSSTQVSQSGDYHVNVYHRDPATSVNAAIQFSVAYGHRLGSGSYGDPNTTGQNVNDTPSRAVYGQYRNQLLPPTDTVFTFGSDNSLGTNDADEIFVINLQRARFRQKMDPGNWELRIGSGSTLGSATAYSSFIDTSNAGEDFTINEAGRVFAIKSGSGGVTASAVQYGLFYPDQAILVFHAGRLRASLGMPINSASAASYVQARNHVTMSMAIKNGTYFAARSEEKVTSTHFFVRITNREFNYSNNPTFVSPVSGSLGAFRHPSMLRNPSVYITTIGMYDSRNRLVALAKLSRPLLKSFNREALIKVKLDY